MNSWKKNTKFIVLGLFVWHASMIGHHSSFSLSSPLMAKENKFYSDITPIYIALSVQWEGNHLKNHNLKTLEKIKEVIPGFTINHFVSPAYFLKPGIDPIKIREIIRKKIRPIDEVGLHLSSWKSILTAAKVSLNMSEETFWGGNLNELNCNQDCGDSVALSSYSKDDITKIISISLKTLEDNSFSKIKSYIVKGWMSSENILNTAANLGLKYDFSPIALHLIRKRIYNYPIYEKLAGIWPHISPYSQPYNTQTESNKEVTQIAGGAAMVDYMSLSEIEVLFNSYLARKAANPNHPLVFHLGMYQETANQYGPKFISAIKRILATASKHRVNIRPLKLNQAIVQPR